MSAPNAKFAYRTDFGSWNANRGRKHRQGPHQQPGGHAVRHICLTPTGNPFPAFRGFFNNHTCDPSNDDCRGVELPEEGSSTVPARHIHPDIGQARRPVPTENDLESRAETFSTAPPRAGRTLPPRPGLTTHFPAIAVLAKYPGCGIVRAARGRAIPPASFGTSPQGRA